MPRPQRVLIQVFGQGGVLVRVPCKDNRAVRKEHAFLRQGKGVRRYQKSQTPEEQMKKKYN